MKFNNKQICGIYKITNLVNGKFYIGSAKDIDIRWKEHLSLLRHNRHYNKHLQSAWNKYGEDNFDFVVLEECTKENRFVREQYYLDTTKCYEENIGYNNAKSANWVADHDEVDKKISDTLKKKKRPKARAGYATFSEEQIKKVVELLQDNTITVKRIVEITGVTRSTINNILYRNGWSYLTEGIKFPPRLKRRQIDKRKKLSEGDVKEIIKRILNGESSISIAKDYNIQYQCIDSIRRHESWKDLTEGIKFPSPLNNKRTSKLLKNDVIEILRMNNNGSTIDEILLRYPQVKQKTVNDIINNKTWKQIDRTKIFKEKKEWMN